MSAGGQKSKFEGALPGTVGMLHTLLVNFPSSVGLAHIFLFEHGKEQDAPYYRSYQIMLMGNENHRYIGAIELQQLPGERVLFTVHSRPTNLWKDEPLRPGDAEAFQEFHQRLTGRLIQLGLIALPEAPKAPRPFGFLPPTEPSN